MDNPATIRPELTPQQRGAMRVNALRKAGLPSPLANVDPKQVIERYLQDEQTSTIAASLGVHRSALNQWLLANNEEEWKAAQAARAITAFEQSKADLASANDPLSLARAREQARVAMWELERTLKRVYGQDQPVQQAAVSISIHIGGNSVSQVEGSAAQDIGSIGQIIDNAD